MDIARLAYVVALVVLGLGALRLLAALAMALPVRDRDDWPAIVWGGAILAQLAALGRDVLAVSAIATAWTWTGLALLALFVALPVVGAVLVLPLSRSQGATPADRFAGPGRLAVAALAAFNGLALATNGEVWHEGLLTESARINLALLLVCGGGLFGARSRVTLAAACGYILILGWQMVEGLRAGY